MWRRWPPIRQIKLNLIRFARLNGTPDDIAKGTALGIFIGMTPTMGMQMPIAVFFAWLLKENKIAAALGVWITNPVTAPFIYALEYETGRILLGYPRIQFPDELTFELFKKLGWEFAAPLCAGSLLYAVICGILTYAIALRMVPELKAVRIPRWHRPRSKAQQKS